MMSSPDHPLAAAALQRILESLPDLYLVLAPDLTIVAVSEAYVQAAMTSREALVGHGLFEVFPANPQDPTAAGVIQLRASLERVLAEGIPHTIPVHKYDIPQRGRQAGAFVERYWSVLNTPMFDAQHEIAYLLHRVEDVTEFVQLQQHKQEHQEVTAELRTRLGQMEAEIYRRAQEVQEANQQLRRANETLREQNLALEQAQRAKDRFLASMSHELRTPLNAVIGFTGTLLMRLPGPLTADQDKQLRTVQGSARHLLSLINDLLDVAKIESGKVDLTLEPVLCQSVVQEVAGALRPLAEGKGLAFVVTTPAADLVIQTDRRALSQILLNLTHNALKFTETGRVCLTLSQRQTDGRRLTDITVMDTGIGIQATDQATLFHAFTQVPASPKRRDEGTGLGLHLSRKLAELLGGQLTCQSEFGTGSTFTVTLTEG